MQRSLSLNTYLYTYIDLYLAVPSSINMKNFFDRGVNKGFNELECNDKTEKYLNSINMLNSKVVYNDIFVTLKKMILNEFNFENQQFIY